MININNTDEQQEKEPQVEKKPDENSGLVLQGFFKITDPETGEIITQGRA